MPSISGAAGRPLQLHGGFSPPRASISLWHPARQLQPGTTLCFFYVLIFLFWLLWHARPRLWRLSYLTGGESGEKNGIWNDVRRKDEALSWRGTETVHTFVSVCSCEVTLPEHLRSGVDVCVLLPRVCVRSEAAVHVIQQLRSSHQVNTDPCRLHACAFCF